MTWKIRKELRKHLKDISFNVASLGNNWYEVKIKCPSNTIEDTKQALDTRDMVYKGMTNFETENGVVLTITI